MSAWVDPACPLDFSHPVNRGLLLNLAVVPNAGWRGGLTWRDMVRGGRRANDATLVNGPTWAGGAGRPGGYGSISFDGSNDSATIAAVYASLTDFTLAAWTFNAWTYGPSKQPVVFKFGTSAWQVVDAGLGGFQVRYYNGTTSLDSTGAAVPASAWCHVASSRLGTSLTHYLGGVALSTGTISGAQPAASAVGTYTGGAANFWLGRLDDLRVYGRALGGGEVRGLYEESRRGYPDAWRWLPARVWFLPAAAPAAPPRLAFGGAALRGGS